MLTSEVGPLLDASIAAARATGDSGRFAVGLAHRGWVALRRGDLAAAEADTRTALAADELPAPTFYRVLNAGILIDTLVERGDLDEAEAVLAPVDAEARERIADRRDAPLLPRAGCGWRRAGRARGWPTCWRSAS